MEYDLIGIGNALVDIEVRVSDDFIKQSSLTKGGMTLCDEEEQKKILRKLDNYTKKISSGGSAANTIHGVSVLGGKTYYLGKVADDFYGQHYIKDMGSVGVGFSGAGSDSNTTGTCIVFVSPDGERTMCTHLGVSAFLSPENVDEKIITNAAMIYIEGYLWTSESSRNAALKLVEIAKKNKLPVAFTLSDAFIVNSFKNDLKNFIHDNVDILFCNEVEALAMGETKSLDDAFTLLKDITNKLFVTIGKNGSLVSELPGEKIEIGVFPNKVVDTTGAGDLFAAGTLFGIIQKYSLRESAILGSFCASEVVSHMGARMPKNSTTNAKKIIGSYQKMHPYQ